MAADGKTAGALGRRLLVSAVLIPALIGLFWADHRFFLKTGFILLALSLLLAVRSAWELCRLLEVRSFAPCWYISGGLAAVVVLSGWTCALFGYRPPDTAINMQAIAGALTAAVLVLFSSAAARFKEPGRSMETLGAELLVVAYVGLLLAVTGQLRWIADGKAGYLGLGSLVVAAKCGDIGAYTLGRLFGKRKMAPRLSPGKTWMGGLGALLGAALGAWLWLQFATPRFDSFTAPGWYWSLLYGAIIGAVGLLGDLCESLIKRDVGKKDAAALFPGFGGLLDLLDSVLYAGPVALLLWKILPLIP